MDLPEHRCCTKIEETTNQTKSQQMNPVLVFGESRQPEYLGKKKTRHNHDRVENQQLKLYMVSRAKTEPWPHR